MMATEKEEEQRKKENYRQLSNLILQFLQRHLHLPDPLLGLVYFPLRIFHLVPSLALLLLRFPLCKMTSGK